VDLPGKATLLVDSRSGGRGGSLSWLLLGMGSVASLAANVAVAEPDDVAAIRGILREAQEASWGSPGGSRSVWRPASLARVSPSALCRCSPVSSAA